MNLLNRDLSWLSFNLRVLQQAADETLPLYERLKFMAIFSSNLDEFFRVRYPEVLALALLSKKAKKNIEHFENKIIQKIKDEIQSQLNYFGEIFHQKILPSLKDNGIIFYYKIPVREEHLPEIRELFLSKVLSFIQPIYLDGKSKKRFMPDNNQLYLVITLAGKKDGEVTQAIINIPSKKLKRFIALTPIENINYVIFLDDIIRENMVYLFPGQYISGVYSIKVTRDSELHLADEYSGNLLQKIEKQLKKREFGPPSRLLFQSDMPRNLQMFLASEFNISSYEMFAGDRYHNLDDLKDFPVFDTKLFFDKQTPLSSSNVMNSGDIFKVLIKKDILLHVPYQSYNPVLSFFNQAAIDVNVTDIYITLYRVAEESHILNALVSAAKNGKRVTAFVEIKARFDEANNIRWSKVMKEAGIKILYSIPEIKVHSKIALVRKINGNKKQSFAVISTGNFNEITAQFYTDHVLMTTDKSITNELFQLLKFLELRNEVDTSSKLKFNSLLVSPFNMVQELDYLLSKEIQQAKKGNPSLVRIKVNNLEDPEFIKSLYKAASSGVKIQLLVRGICAIVPGIPGAGENIMVKRIVDRYLEHSRFLIYGTGEKCQVIMGSADLMARNLHHRIEVYVKIKDSKCRNELIHYFDLQWADTDKSVWLLPDYQQQLAGNENDHGVNAQQRIYNYLLNHF